MEKIAVFFGGENVEHDISVITGVLTLNALKGGKYNPVPVYVDNSGEWFTGDLLFDLENYKSLDIKKLKRVTLIGGSPVLYLVKKGKGLRPIEKITCAINCMHGERGEDGSLAGLLKLCKVPLASPDMAASAVFMDKRLTKILLKGIGVKTLPCKVFNSLSGVITACYPVVVKPNKLGSSIGVSTALNDEELRSGVALSLRYGDTAIAEHKIEGFTEINCAAYKNAQGEIVVSECEKPVNKGGVLTFNDKYTGGEREFPAKIDVKTSNRVKRITKKIYEYLDFCGVIRIDFFVRSGEVIVNEVNTVPGSMAYYLFNDTLSGFNDMLEDMIKYAVETFAKQETFIKKYDSGVLNVTGTKGSKRLK